MENEDSEESFINIQGSHTPPPVLLEDIVEAEADIHTLTLRSESVENLQILHEELVENNYHNVLSPILSSITSEDERMQYIDLMQDGTISSPPLNAPSLVESIASGAVNESDHPAIEEIINMGFPERLWNETDNIYLDPSSEVLGPNQCYWGQAGTGALNIQTVQRDPDYRESNPGEGYLRVRGRMMFYDDGARFFIFQHSSPQNSHDEEDNCDDMEFPDEESQELMYHGFSTQTMNLQERDREILTGMHGEIVDVVMGISNGTQRLLHACVIPSSQELSQELDEGSRVPTPVPEQNRTIPYHSRGQTQRGLPLSLFNPQLVRRHDVPEAWALEITTLTATQRYVIPLDIPPFANPQFGQAWWWDARTQTLGGINGPPSVILGSEHYMISEGRFISCTPTIQHDTSEGRQDNSREGQNYNSR